MAQIAEDKNAVAERAVLLLRQRPGAVLLVTLSLGLVLGAATFGILTAQGAFDSTAGLEIARDGEDGGSLGGDAAGGDDGGGATSASEVEEDGERAEKEDETLVVDVSGAVASPAVVTLRAGARVQDAIEAAGGLTDDADISALNRAAACADGQKVYVPRKGETVPAEAPDPAQQMGSGLGSSLVNINTADEATLDGLPGVGPSTARAIVEDREANGPFSGIEDLMRVSGIGEKKFDKLKSSICV